MNLYAELAKCHPSIERGMVWCTTCKRKQRVDPAECFRSGWPRCCGYTMTIDSPQKRAALKRAASRRGEGL
jgi:hypothetical protein